MNKKVKNSFLIVLVILVVVTIASLIQVTKRADKVTRDFQEEMALRMDFEEKLLSLKKEKSSLLSELEVLRVRAKDCNEELAFLNEQVLEERQKTQAAQEALNQMRLMLHVQESSAIEEAS